MVAKHDHPPASSDAEPYMRAFLDITQQPCLTRMEKVRRVMKEYGMSVPPEDVHLKLVLGREIFSYQLEMNKKYKDKYSKSSFLRDLFDIDTKDRALFRIVSFDKAWLFTDLVKKRTLRAQEDGDRTFLKGLGEAIAKEPKIKPIRAAPPGERSENYQRVLDFAEAYIDSRGELHKGAIHELHELLGKKHEVWFPDKLRIDEQTFYKFLLRNSIILTLPARRAIKKIAPSFYQEK